MKAKEKEAANGRNPKKPDIKKIGKAAAHTAAGAALAGSVFLGSLFSSPAEVMEGSKDAPTAATAIVQTEELPPEPEFFAAPEAEPEAEKRRSLKERIKAALLRLPAAVRAAVLLPMWAVGFAVLWIVGAISGLASMPLIGPIVKFILGIAIVAAAVVIGEKLLFPDVPIKKLLSKRNLVPLVICAAGVSLAGTFGGMLWKDKPYITPIVDMGFAAVYLLSFWMMRLEERRKKRA
ncbi:MAG: hypothetical protein II756_04265 [Clostridia bacterium]|nr:hypothetical protein [Clostridia bacterium]